MWRTLLVTTWPRRGREAPSGAQAAEAARVTRTGALAALAGALGGVAAVAPHVARARHNAGMVGFKAVAPFGDDACSVHRSPELSRIAKDGYSLDSVSARA